jgi:DNA-binding beta-propeller fold protein YncE
VTGALVRIMSGRRYGFDDPAALAVAGGHLWVASALGNSVSEIDAGTGALLHTMSAGFANPTGLAASGSDVWVTSLGSDSVTRLRAG